MSTTAVTRCASQAHMPPLLWSSTVLCMRAVGEAGQCRRVNLVPLRLQEIGDANLRFLTGWDEADAIAVEKLALEDFAVLPKLAAIVLLFSDQELAEAVELLDKLH